MSQVHRSNTIGENLCVLNNICHKIDLTFVKKQIYVQNKFLI